MKVRSVRAAVLLALRDDELLISEGANHRPHLDAEFAGRPQAAMPESDLVALGAIGLRTNQNRDVLPVLTDELAEGGVLLLGSLHAVGHEGVVNQRRVEFDDDLAFDELLLDFFRALDLLGDTAKRLRYCAEGARLFDRAIKSEKRSRALWGCFVHFCSLR